MPFNNVSLFPSNFIIVCVGDLDEDNLLRKIQDKLRNITRTKVNIKKNVPAPLRKGAVKIEKNAIEPMPRLFFGPLSNF